MGSSILYIVDVSEAITATVGVRIIITKPLNISETIREAFKSMGLFIDDILTKKGTVVCAF